MRNPFSSLLATALLAMCASAATAAGPAPAASAPAAKPAVATDTLADGIVVAHTKLGTGASPGPTDTVRVNYRGKFESGFEFDSSYKRGEPASLQLDGVIPCWTQALQKMKVGGTATIKCPPATAYGARPPTKVIPPNATLTFDVELLAIEKKR